MSTTYSSKHATQANPSRRWGKRKIAAVAAGAILAVSGGTAWAAVSLFGLGSINAAAASSLNLKVDNATVQLTGQLLPGLTVGAKAEVSNPNDFPVNITDIIVKNASVRTTPKLAACASSIHLVGTATTWPVGGGAGTLVATDTKVTIPAHKAAWITLPEVLKQDALASVLCGAHADFAVQAVAAGS